MKKVEPREWLSWTAVALLACLCSLLAVLQYRWIGEIRDAERDRLRTQLHSDLDQVSRSFNAAVRTAVSALAATTSEVSAAGRTPAYSLRYLRWRQESSPLFSRIGLAVPDGGDVQYWNLDLNTGRFTVADWPPDLAGSHRRVEAHLDHQVPGGTGEEASFEVPRFAPSDDGGAREQEWLVLELNVERVRSSLLPELLNRYLGVAGRLEYDAEVVDRATAALIYQTANDAHTRIDNSADGSVALFDTRQFSLLNGGGQRGGGAERGGPRNFGRGDGRGRDGRGPGPPPEGRRGPPHDFGEIAGYRPPPRKQFQEIRSAALQDAGPPPGGPGNSNDGRWMLLVRHQAGSLDAAVSRIRIRNMAVSGGLLLLIIATAGIMARSSRQAAHLAGLQMNFVAGVSHELRTPLTVIRTAAYNLRGRVAIQPAAMERYGKLIQDESEKLTLLVEQVLQFAAAKSGSLIKRTTPVSVELLVEDSLAASSRALSDPAITLEKKIAEDLPLIMADGLALRHAIQNLIENAVKYGAGDSHWVGISAMAPGAEPHWVEIRVADHGHGIPSNEQSHIFEPFIRGRRAIEDQIHGTGLGLSLVKTIVEAHGGTITVHSAPQTGTEFVVRIPAAPTGTVDEFANTTG